MSGLVCSSCGSRRAARKTATGLLRVNPPWKRLASGTILCGPCKATRFVLRAVALPVVGPIDGTWKELGDALHGAFSQATALSNRAVTELVRRDVVRTPVMKKLPAMARVDLYAIYRDMPGLYPDLGSQSAVSLLHAVERRYRAARLDVIWRGAASVPTYRYPQPLPVHNQGWGPEMEGGCPVVAFRVGGRRWQVRLRSGPEFRRQLIGFRQLVVGEAEKGELSLYRQGDVVMCKMVGYFPRAERVAGQHTMNVETNKDAFWIAEMEGRPPWILNADHVRRWQAEHMVYLQRMAEDTKYEKRWPKVKRAQINESRARRCDKHHRRLDAWLHQATALLAEYAVRGRVGVIHYDDECKDYLPRFPWYKLKLLLKTKLDERGIGFTAAGIDTE